MLRRIFTLIVNRNYKSGRFEQFSSWKRTAHKLKFTPKNVIPLFMKKKGVVFITTTKHMWVGEYLVILRVLRATDTKMTLTFEKSIKNNQ